ncbi:MAG: TIGR04282 family arsenosugar biosynthesis glycosyltransferase [Acidimicrobiales bacterium]
MAKEPRPGFAKTRLALAVGASGAGRLAAALLTDAVEAVCGCGASRRVVAYVGRQSSWLPDGMTPIAQRGIDLAARLAYVVGEVGAPLLIVAADSPEMTAPVIDRALRLLVCGEHDAVVGPTHDGGYWGIGLTGSWTDVFEGVPMSAPDTAEVQIRRLHQLGLRTAGADLLWDVDDEPSAEAAARARPDSAFAGAWRTLNEDRAPVAVLTERSSQKV